MLDSKIHSLYDNLIGKHLAKLAIKLHLTANKVTLIGFGFAIIAFISILAQQYEIGLVFILLNRLADGLDGAVARATSTSKAGGFLDITLDFYFYSMIVAAFGLADLQNNATAAITLMLAFLSTGVSFLALASAAKESELAHLQTYQNKAIYYSSALAESTETMICFILMCLLPQYFAYFAYVFAIICFVSAFFRVKDGYLKLKLLEKP